MQPCEGDAVIGQRVGRFPNVEGVTNEPPLAQKECVQILQCGLREKAARKADGKAVLVGFCHRFLSRNRFFRRFHLNLLVCFRFYCGRLIRSCFRLAQLDLCRFYCGGFILCRFRLNRLVCPCICAGSLVLPVLGREARFAQCRAHTRNGRFVNGIVEAKATVLRDLKCADLVGKCRCAAVGRLRVEHLADYRDHRLALFLLDVVIDLHGDYPLHVLWSLHSSLTWEELASGFCCIHQLYLIK